MKSCCLAAGDIDGLKENCFCNYDYLLAGMHARSVSCLISALEKGFCHVLDAEIHVILRCVVHAKRILLRDPLQLASELIGRLRQVKGRLRGMVFELQHVIRYTSKIINYPFVKLNITMIFSSSRVDKPTDTEM